MTKKAKKSFKAEIKRRVDEIASDIVSYVETLDDSDCERFLKELGYLDDEYYLGFGELVQDEIIKQLNKHQLTRLDSLAEVGALKVKEHIERPEYIYHRWSLTCSVPITLDCIVGSLDVTAERSGKGSKVTVFYDSITLKKAAFTKAGLSSLYDLLMGSK